jgi:aspartokinase
VIVCKFGGTSVADAAAIRRLIEIVRRRVPEKPLVVVSALAGVTNALFGLSEPLAAGSEAGLRAAVDALAARHHDTARALGLPEAAGSEPTGATPALLDTLRPRLGGAPGAELLDTIASYGELWSSRLVAASLA